MNLSTNLVDVAVKDLCPMALDLLVAAYDATCKGINWAWVPSDCPAGGFYEGRAQLETNAPEVVCVYIAQRGVLDVVKYPHMRGIPRYAPSTAWNTGGHLVDQYRMSFVTEGTGPADDTGKEPVLAIPDRLQYEIGSGPTHLIAACRAIVSTELGGTVKVPACLVLS
jgi:hypothetical protein